MTNEQKSIIMQLRMEGCKYTAIAEVVELSVNTVKSYCRRQNIDTAFAITSDENGTSRCKQCNKPLERKDSQKPSKFCSDDCRHMWWKDHPNEINKKAFYTKACAHCGKAYTVYGRPHSKFCSHACSSQHRIKKAETST